MNRATEIVLEIAEGELLAWGFDADTVWSGDDIYNFFLQLMEDHADDYDADWFPIVATPSIRKTVDWAEIGKIVTQKNVEARSEDECD